MITPMTAIVGLTNVAIPTDGQFPPSTYCLTIQNTHATQDLFFNFDNGTITFMRIPAGKFKTIDLTPINRVRVAQGKKLLQFVKVYLQGSGTGTTVEILVFDEFPSTGIQEQQ